MTLTNKTIKIINKSNEVIDSVKLQNYHIGYKAGLNGNTTSDVWHLVTDITLANIDAFLQGHADAYLIVGEQEKYNATY